jgi:Fe-S cluster biogenesis protein NfuA
MEQSQSEIQIGAELTPNPNTLKFNINRTFLESGSCNCPTLEKAQESSPLAVDVFAVPLITGVMIGTDFVTVTKDPNAEWYNLVPTVVEKIKAFIVSEQPAVTKADESTGPTTTTRTEIEQQIIAILDNEIRPAVARDGGDIVFYGYDDGVVKLHLQGSCSSCPSSVMTLKMGIENRLKQALPEIKEVIQV